MAAYCEKRCGNMLKISVQARRHINDARKLLCRYLVVHFFPYSIVGKKDSLEVVGTSICLLCRSVTVLSFVSRVSL